MDDKSTLTIATTAELRVRCDGCKCIIQGSEHNQVIVAGDNYVVLCEMCKDENRSSNG